jgi:hypothetical protein
VQVVVGELFDELITKSEDELYRLQLLPDICSSDFYCRGVPSIELKPFIEAALARVKTRDTNLAAKEANTIAAASLHASRLSLTIAFAAFLVSVIALVTKKKERT